MPLLAETLQDLNCGKLPVENVRLLLQSGMGAVRGLKPTPS